MRKDCECRQRQAASAFTLVELLVVIAIISLLAAMLLPVLHAARLEAKNSACISQVRQVYVAVALYEDERGSLPHVGPTPNSGAVNQTYFTSAADKGIGLGLLIPHYLADHRVLFCPDVKIIGGWGAGIAAWTNNRNNCLKNLPTLIATGQRSRCDYSLGYTGAPTSRKFMEIDWGYGKMKFWIADDYCAFDDFGYKKISHGEGKYMNIGRIDGGVRTIIDWRIVQPYSGNASYYRPYN
ncbi:MAG: type II secretion system GspH family protein, partial [Planctomycetota bacterium]|nr:type II secretion system GspH family protein [Planctomycetota bacterium]